MTTHPHKGWYTARKIPHFDAPHTQQFITFRLSDALPQSVLRELRKESDQLPATQRGEHQRQRIEHWLDQGLGCCALRHPEVAKVMYQALNHYHEKHYRLIAWCIMPNHVHVIIESHYSLPRIVQAWKSYTARWTLNQAAGLELNIPTGGFWMRGYWDRFIRNPQHLQRAIDYVHQNPVQAGLCQRTEDWRWSSAYSEIK